MTEVVSIECPSCNKSTQALKVSRVLSKDGKYDKLLCMGCKKFVHRKQI